MSKLRRVCRCKDALLISHQQKDGALGSDEEYAPLTARHYDKRGLRQMSTPRVSYRDTRSKESDLELAARYASYQFYLLVDRWTGW